MKKKWKTAPTSTIIRELVYASEMCLKAFYSGKSQKHWTDYKVELQEELAERELLTVKDADFLNNY